MDIPIAELKKAGVMLTRSTFQEQGADMELTGSHQGGKKKNLVPVGMDVLLR